MIYCRIVFDVYSSNDGNSVLHFSTFVCSVYMYMYLGTCTLVVCAYTYVGMCIYIGMVYTSLS